MNSTTANTSFPNNDAFWVQTLEFLQKHVKASELVIAPEEFSTVLDTHLPSRSIATIPRVYDWIVVHKGQLNNYNLNFLRVIEDQHVPVFYNEVFVIFLAKQKLSLPRKFKNLLMNLDAHHINSFRENLSKLLYEPRLNITPVMLSDLLDLSKGGKPNLNPLSEVTRDLEIIKLNIKNFGYQLAKDLSDSYAKDRTIPDTPCYVRLASKPTTQADIESEWVSYWCDKLHIQPIFHRKIWELCYVPQALHEYMGLSSGLSGIGFGCGEEPLPSLFASMGIDVTVTDLEPEKSEGLGWVETAQHTKSLESVYYPDLVDQEVFNNRVSLKYVDMNHIPETLAKKYDFCWSICALEHLGSVQLGLDFIENSLQVLKPGGVAVHTTEYNYTNHPFPITDWPTVMFQDKDFISIASKLQQQGHSVIPLSFDKGNLLLDGFIDIPPYNWDAWRLSAETWGNVNQAGHLNLSVDGYPCTCFGIIIKKSQR